MRVDDHRSVGSDAAVAAAERAEELRDLIARIDQGGRIDQADVDHALDRAREAHVRARRASATSQPI
ncbi:hypothetical protein AU191_18415 [Mycolicibacterium acapulense]|nr:hypothetical protein AU191_18415 [Mycolicibacterium acapulense]